MTSPHKLLIIQPQDRVIRIQEIRMEHNLHPIVMPIEQLHASNLVQNRVRTVVDHVVRHDRWERVPLEREDAAFELDLVLFGEEVLERWEFFAVFTLASIRNSVRAIFE